jgi:hypothetical protein
LSVYKNNQLFRLCGKINFNIKYDYVILDECTFIKTHFISGTIKSHSIDSILYRFKRYLCLAEKIFLLQHDITEHCVEFYSNLARVNDPKIEVKKFKFEKKLDLLPLVSSTNIYIILENLIYLYIQNFNVNLGKSNLPIIIFCTKAKISFQGTGTLLQSYKIIRLYTI